MLSSFRIAAVLTGVALCLAQGTHSGEGTAPSPPETSIMCSTAPGGAPNARRRPRSDSLDNATPDTPRVPLVNLKVTVYEFDLKDDSTLFNREGELRAAAVSEAAFEKMLGEVGEFRRVADVDGSADLNDEYELTQGASMPIPQSSQQSKGGTIQTSVSYQDIGMLLELSHCSYDAAAESIRADVELELSTVRHSNIKIGSDIYAPIFLKNKRKSGMQFKLGAPLVTFEVTDWADHAPARAIVVRYLITSFEKPE